MDKKQSRTYLLYSRGLMPNDLTLGSLFLDPANPTDSERKTFPYTGTVQPQRLRPIQLDQPCSLTAHVSTEWLAGAGVLGLLRGEVSPSSSVDVTVSGTKGRRLQLLNPEDFLNEVILKSDKARAWLASKLSVLHHMPIIASLQRSVSKEPKIWMVTGIQYIENGTVTSASSDGKSIKLQAAVPAPDPTLVATLADIPAVDVTGSLDLQRETNATYGYEDERVWAAQFRALDVRLRRKSEKGVAEQEDTWIEVEDAKHLRRYGIRGDDQGADDGEGGALLAQVTGVSNEDEDNEAVTTEPSSMLDRMLDVNWTLLDELLALQDEESEGEDEA